ncbi:lanthionine synthetase LanC family protein [Actinophytocola gossypii]|uniref:Subtilin biosynthesis protein spaC n=1 Tax=Actinophytocola gossypii TaxID=2812003 RepID=A0ABT2J2S1_9PSEU|nr:lanthionine synthetase LanC family protein [Actinophytocola gossypii]MCT2581899.1 hypothetical protein [Actinophytocola gossypii]
MPVRTGPTSDLTDAAELVLAPWTASADADTAGPDLGPVVLATLVGDTPAVDAWLRRGTRCGGGLGLFGGTGTLLAGLRLVADRYPGAAGAADRAGSSIARATHRWRTTNVGLADYDLVGGPAGVLLAHLAGTGPVDRERLAPPLAHLVALAATGPDGFRIGAHAGHPLVGWAQGGVVTGLAHGVAGPLAALGLALPHLPPGDRTADAVHRLATWLAAGGAPDDQGIVSWPRRAPAMPVRTARRHGWCYGTPGVSWALWVAGRALLDAGQAGDGGYGGYGGGDGGGDGGLAVSAYAEAAMRTLCERYDPDLHLDHDPLGICHGAAGVLLVADAFARHAGLPEAATLRDDLCRYLRERLDDVARLGPDLLCGATGVLAALLTAEGGDRGWLRCLALY